MNRSHSKSQPTATCSFAARNRSATSSSICKVFAQQRDDGLIYIVRTSNELICAVTASYRRTRFEARLTGAKGADLLSTLSIQWGGRTFTRTACWLMLWRGAVAFACLAPRHPRFVGVSQRRPPLPG